MSQLSQKTSKTLINGKSVKTFMKKGNMNPRVINAILKGVIPPIPRYVLNNKTKETLTQDDDYGIFCEQVSKLKSKSKNMQYEEVLRICEELEEIAPKYVKL